MTQRAASDASIPNSACRRFAPPDHEQGRAQGQEPDQHKYARQTRHSTPPNPTMTEPLASMPSVSHQFKVKAESIARIMVS